MDNQTLFQSFYILGFSIKEDKSSLLFLAFFLIYIIGVLGNIVIIMVVYRDPHLHSPMYFFLCNLSFADICYTSVTLPKLMDILLTGKNIISFIPCFTQMYFFILMAFIEITLLSSMAYDRYVAICKPLQYHILMNKQQCVLIVAATWISGCGNSFFVTGLVSAIPFCRSTRIQNFYCDPKTIVKISCADTRFHILFYSESFLIGLLPFLLSLTSYFKIITSILRIKSTDGRRKAFSTCTSHLTVLTLFYVTLMCTYGKPPLEHIDSLDQFFSVLYAAVSPMLNPLIYSLRNKEVQGAFMRLVRLKAK